MADIVLATANARYSHASIGARYLLANMGRLEPVTRLVELTLEERPIDMAERILAESPRVVGLGVYVWNVELMGDLARLIGLLDPRIAIVMGGPEVCDPEDLPRAATFANHIVCGEADLAFAALCERILDGESPRRIVVAQEPPLSKILLPYRLYRDDDIAHRIVYVETSRGCPHGCEFCLASRSTRLRRFPAEGVLEELDSLWRRGARRFKFVDRTLTSSGWRPLHDWLAPRAGDGLFAHFELVPDRVAASLIDDLSVYPEGAVQLEVGVQTLDEPTAARVGRRQDPQRVLENIERLRRDTGAHLHADLVVGLPGESLARFGQGFDRLIAAGPHEIQVGVLKRLRGAPIARHDREFMMRYNPRPPYNVLATADIAFTDVQRLSRFARYLDLVFNSGSFRSTAPLLWGDGSPFDRFLALTDWLHRRVGRTHAIALNRLATHLFTFLTKERGLPAALVADAIAEDFARVGRRSFPGALQPHVSRQPAVRISRSASRLPSRQRRHAAGGEEDG